MKNKQKLSVKKSDRGQQFFSLVLISVLCACSNRHSSYPSAINSASLGAITQPSVTVNFSNDGTYTGMDDANPNMKCLRSPEEGALLDNTAPEFRSELRVNISPDANNRPQYFDFSAVIHDEGCGASRLSGICSLHNVTARAEADAWALQEPGRKWSDWPEIPSIYVLSSNIDCMAKSEVSSNSFSQYLTHFLSHTRVHDEVIVSIQVTDNAQNTNVSSTRFFIFDELLDRVTIGSRR